MNILSRLLLRLGYVRLRDYGYTLTSAGRIVELPRVTDDRFAPPPWEPIAWQGASASLSSGSPPVPRPLPPPPHGADVVSGPETALSPETRPPAEIAAISGAPARNEAEEEEREWREALSRARERAARDAAAARRDPTLVPPRPPPVRAETRTRIGAGPPRAPGARAATQPIPSIFAPRPGASAGLRGGSRVSSPASHPASALMARSGGADGGRAARGTEDPLDDTIACELPESDLELEMENGQDFADGSRKHPIARREPGDITATDLASIQPAARENDDDTRVDATAAALAGALHRARAPGETELADPEPAADQPSPVTLR